MADRIEPDSRALQDRRVSGPRPPAQGPDPGDQLGEGEWLGQVVIGAEVQPRHPLGQVPGGRQHEDPDRGAARGQRPAYLIPGHDRQVAVQDDHVVMVNGQALLRGSPVEDHVDGHGLAAQPVRDGAGQLPRILHHQNPH
jgi:hypothetical protein